MDSKKLLRVILPDVLIDNFDVDRFKKTDTRFDIWLDEKKVKTPEDRRNRSVTAYGFGEYHTIRDFPIRGTKRGADVNLCPSFSSITQV